MSMLKDKAELERLLFQYIERYGLTEEARRYFAQREALREDAAISTRDAILPTGGG